MRSILVLLAMCAAGWPGVAQPVIHLQPGASAVQVGETFGVEVRIASYENVRAFSVELHYNQAAVEHTALVQGSIFSAGGGPGGIFLTPASDADLGYILADEARIGGGGSSGEDGLLFEITFTALAAGSTNIWFGDVLLRDASNQPMEFDLEAGVASVVSPVPDIVVTRMFEPGEGTDGPEEWTSTGVFLDMEDAGVAPHAKLSVARYESAPPGGEDAPFVDPDGQVEHLGVVDAYWELTSSLDGEVIEQMAFSYAGLDGPKNPSDFRLARRPLGSGEEDGWALLPGAAISVDTESALIVVDIAAVGFEAAQYALVFDRIVSMDPFPNEPATTIRAVYPNPVETSATVEYTIATVGPVEIDLLDLLGRRVATLVDDVMQVGEHQHVWNPADHSAGIYFVRLRHPGGVHTVRVVIVR